MIAWIKRWGVIGYDMVGLWAIEDINVMLEHIRKRKLSSQVSHRGDAPKGKMFKCKHFKECFKGLEPIYVTKQFIYRGDVDIFN